MNNPKNSSIADDVVADMHLRTFERLLKAHDAMTTAEKDALMKWEAEFVTGNGKYGTSDWPGWVTIIARVSN